MALRHAATRALLPCCFATRRSPGAKPGVVKLERTPETRKFLRVRVEEASKGCADCEGDGTGSECKFYVMEVHEDDLAVAGLPIQHPVDALSHKDVGEKKKGPKMIALCSIAMVKIETSDPDKIRGSHRWYLGMNDAGELRADMPLCTDSVWLVEPQEPGSIRPATSSHSPAYYPEVRLGLDQVDNFVKEGFLCVRGAVDEKLVDRALRAINFHLGQLKVNGGKPDPDPGFALPSKDVHVLDLLHQSSVWTLAHRLIGIGKVRTKGQAQCALRFPELEPDLCQVDIKRQAWHVDGANVNKRSPFTVLLGVCLSDQLQENVGNLCVYPGSHVKCYEALYQANELDPGSPPRQNVWQGLRPRMDSEPRQMLLRRGDVVFIHSKLAHTVAPNLSPNIRYQVYFRMFHVDHDPTKVNLWEDFEGVQSALEEMYRG